jgi:hypothetical protein
LYEQRLQRQYTAAQGLSHALHIIRYAFVDIPTSIVAGYQRTYGRPEPQKLLAAEIGRTKRSRDPAKSKKYANDGRAPDTTAQAPDMQSAKRTKIDADDKTAPPADLTPISGSAAQNTIVIDGTRHQIERPGPGASYYVSYAWAKNSCWLDTSLELLFILHHTPSLKPFWTRTRGLVSAMADDSVTFNDIVRHFELREEQTTLNTPNELRTLINIGRDVLHERIMGDQFGEMSSIWV